MPLLWSNTRPAACPKCKGMEAERIGNVVEPGTDAIKGTVYGCCRCRLRFTVVSGNAEAWGNVAEQYERPKLVNEVAESAERDPLVMRDTDLRWDRRR